MNRKRKEVIHNGHMIDVERNRQAVFQRSISEVTGCYYLRTSYEGWIWFCEQLNLCGSEMNFIQKLILQYAELQLKLSLYTPIVWI